MNAWNAAFKTDNFESDVYPPNLKDEIGELDGSFVFDMYKVLGVTIMIKKYSRIVIPVGSYLAIITALLYNTYYGSYSLLEMFQNVFDISLFDSFFWNSKTMEFKHTQYVRKARDFQNNPSLSLIASIVLIIFSVILCVYVYQIKKNSELSIKKAIAIIAPSVLFAIVSILTTVSVYYCYYYWNVYTESV